MRATAGDLSVRAVYDDTPYPLLIQTLALAVILAPTVALLLTPHHDPRLQNATGATAVKPGAPA